MPFCEKEKRTWLIWFGPLFALIYAPLSMIIGDMLLICMHYGSDAYFERGLRIAKHKPYTLSTGVELSNNLSTLGWFIDTGLWLGLVIASMYLLAGVASMFGRKKQGAATQ